MLRLITILLLFLSTPVLAGDPRTGLADGFYSCGSCGGSYQYGGWAGIYGPTPGTPVTTKNRRGQTIVIGWFVTPYRYYDAAYNTDLPIRSDNKRIRGTTGGRQITYGRGREAYVMRDGMVWNGYSWNPVDGPMDNCTSVCN